MNQWMNLSPEEKISLWRKFKNDLKDKTPEQKLQEIAKFWSGVPYGSRTVDYYTPSSWADPWEILYHSQFCRSSITILIYYTLYFCGFENIKLYLIDDSVDEFLVPVVDDQFLLNYTLGEISNWKEIKEEVQVIQSFTSEDIRKIS